MDENDGDDDDVYDDDDDDDDDDQLILFEAWRGDVFTQKEQLFIDTLWEKNKK